MITVMTLDTNKKHNVISTIFPDKTSQVWKLPDFILDSRHIKIIWNFEEEREIIDLINLKSLLNSNSVVVLHMPYMPYARQDKDVSNNSTFSLHTLAYLLNGLNFNLVTANDVHNEHETKLNIINFHNITIKQVIENMKERVHLDVVCFPDRGAESRYSKFFTCKTVVANKIRNQQTGMISNTTIRDNSEEIIKNAENVLIWDDLCDGGRTFIEVAKILKEINPKIDIDLYVSHGIFSKGKEVLHEAGINMIWTWKDFINEYKFVDVY